jgi:hypothetical protein
MKIDIFPLGERPLKNPSQFLVDKKDLTRNKSVIREGKKNFFIV